MSEEEWTAFLREGTRTGKLAIVLSSGRPTVTPVWFLYEDGVIRITTAADSAKARALENDPRASIVVDLEEPPYAFVKVDATATIIDDLTVTRRVATDIGGRYMGANRAEEFGIRNGSQGEITIEFTPTRITAIHRISD
jgi:PPOX class probable F420-dependent enzyme